MVLNAPRFASGLAVIALASLFVPGCGGGGSSAPPPSPPPPPPPPTGGLDARPANTTCLAGDPPGSTLSLAVQRAFASLPNFTQPIAMLQEPGNSARWYVVQKTG
jgi:hypothetical protein